MPGVEHKKYIDELLKRISQITGIPEKEIKIKSTPCRWDPNECDFTVYIKGILNISADYATYKQHGRFVVGGVPIYDELLVKHLWLCGDMYHMRQELDTLRDELSYRPGGPGYNSAKEHFEGMQKQ